MYTDIVGFTALTQRNESETIRLLEEHRQLVRPLFASHRGREIKTIGDAFLVEFQSALDALLCSVAIQQMMHDRKVAWGETLSLRIGIHVGDVMERGNDILGDAVNIASRIEPLAGPGGVCISGQVYEQVRNKWDLPFVSLGEKYLKNLLTPIQVYAVRMPWEQPTPQPTATPPSPSSIAILPFANFSPDPNDEYFADGITDEIISAVAGISGLSVISRTSVMGYKGTTKKVKEIGRELEVGSVLEGSFRKAGNRIRVTTQLIDVAHDRHLWAQNYDRNLDDIFAVQSDVAKQVADALRVRILSPEKERIERKPTESTEAYALCLKGRYYWNEATKEGNDKALSYFNESVRLDPNYALAYAGIADCYHLAGDLHWLPPQEAYPKSRANAEKAIEIDPLLAEAHAALGAVLFHHDWKWSESERELSRAIALRPSYAEAHDFYSVLLLFLLRLDESYEHIMRAHELDPLAMDIGADLGARMYETGKTEEAISHLEKLARTYPDSPYVSSALGSAYHGGGRNREAVQELRRTVELSHGDLHYLAGLGMILGWTEQREEAESILRRLEDSAKRSYVSSVDIAIILESLGRRDDALKCLETAYSSRSGALAGVRLVPEMSELRKDPRWISIEKRMGFPRAKVT
jgi:TolB-like protein/Tfp pilus assembly protein PilF